MKRFYDDQTWPTREIHEVRKGLWAFLLLNCAVRTLIGWAGNLQSYGRQPAKRRTVAIVTSAQIEIQVKTF